MSGFEHLAEAFLRLRPNNPERFDDGLLNAATFRAWCEYHRQHARLRVDTTPAT
jgi:hypothetical protein